MVKQQTPKWMTLWLLLTVVLLLAALLTTATFAWFTTNREVKTDRITAKTGSTALELQISRTNTQPFQPQTITDTAGGKVNGAALNPCDKALMPVSTADLNTFLYCPVMEGDMASNFLPTPDESLYYHDTIYLKAVGEGLPDTSRVALYLEGEPVKSADGKMLAAARLGLRIAQQGQNADSPTTTILTLSDGQAQGTPDTVLEGVDLAAGNVLGYENGKVVAAKDPAVSLTEVRFDPQSPQNNPMTILKLHEVYRVDVYFYLEGTDYDCKNDIVGQTEATLNLAFFGLLAQ